MDQIFFLVLQILGALAALCATACLLLVLMLLVSWTVAVGGSLWEIMTGKIE